MKTDSVEALLWTDGDDQICAAGGRPGFERTDLGVMSPSGENIEPLIT